MFKSVNGFANPALKSVVQCFQNQLTKAGGGAALCVYHHGEPLIDIWSGTRNVAQDPWLKDTCAVSFSTSKGVLSTLLHIILDEAHLDYETQVSHIWPSFKQANKRHITIRQLLCHEAGLFSLADNIEHIHDIYDWDLMVWKLAKAAPSMRHLGVPSYHAVTYGWLLGELIHRLTGQTPGVFLDKEMRSIVGRNNFIGVPPRHLNEVSHLFNTLGDTGTTNLTQTIHNTVNRKLTGLLFKSKNTQAALKPPTSELLDLNDRSFLQAEIPAMNGVFTARGLARLYSLLANNGSFQEKKYINPERLADIQQVQNTGCDRVIFLPMHWRLGYHRILNHKRRALSGFGHFGYGGSGAWCDPNRHLSVGFTINALWGAPFGDYRMAQLAGEILVAIDQLNNG